jgi:hypothetical protein
MSTALLGIYVTGERLFNGNINNVMVKFPIYFTSHMHIDGQNSVKKILIICQL